MTLSDVDVPRDAMDVTFRNIRNLASLCRGRRTSPSSGGDHAAGCRVPLAYRRRRPTRLPSAPKHPLRRRVFPRLATVTADQDAECLQILAGDGITIRNSVFRDCATANDGRGADSEPAHRLARERPETRNILIENNFFYPSGNAYAIQAGDFANLAFRYNSISGPVLVFGRSATARAVGVRREHHANFGDCGAGRRRRTVAPLIYRYNVLRGGRCSPTDIDAPNGFIDPNRDLHLKASQPQSTRGYPKNYPEAGHRPATAPQGRVVRTPAPTSCADSRPLADRCARGATLRSGRVLAALFGCRPCARVVDDVVVRRPDSSLHVSELASEAALRGRRSTSNPVQSPAASRIVVPAGSRR